MSELTVRPATLNDLDAISSINKLNLLINKKEQSHTALEESGFLISQLGAGLLSAMIENNKDCLVLVATNDNQVVGYAITYDLAKIEPESYQQILALADTLQLNMASNPVFYLRQIAKLPDKKGVGSALLNALNTALKQREIKYLVSKIIHQPYMNTVSIVLHKRFCFKEIATGQSNDYVYGVYLKNIEE